MPCFTVPIHEFNRCHNPGGSPEGGRFCSDPEIVGGGEIPVGEVPATVQRWGKEPTNEWGKGSLWFSFPATGGAFTAKRVHSYDLDEIADRLGKADHAAGQEGLAKELEALAPEPPPGYEVVYRIGGETGELAGHNAANARGLTEFIHQMTDDGDLSIKWGFQTAKHKSYLNIYFVKITARGREHFKAGFKRGSWGR